ncbi:IclR family transcriptional regulator [Cohnella pontilimi]|uniref:IclR family transcriptional regulator n=1 Tax=Cohnella pontilimi TaxID=2564100 RepID=A0A4U0FGP8_9BACL|nr:IclR family transcriptional regulator [Cohnella pontilimi]TJY44115.1 IclR family transcriptional regulator [Cohnella pontilimi]
MSETDADLLQTLDRGLDILMRMVDSNGACGVAELSAASGINKSTTFRILRTLQRRGFVSQLPDGKYEVRVETFQFILDRLSGRINLQRIARGELERLASNVNETVTISILTNGQVQCMDKVDSTAAVHVTHLLGRLSPLHAGSSGKAILAFMEPKEREKHLNAQPLKAYTEHTITDRDVLEKELAITRTKGYSESHEELDPGVSAVAAPCFDRFGRVIGSITILGFSQEFTEEANIRYGEAVKQVAAQISSLLGYPLLK